MPLDSLVDQDSRTLTIKVSGRFDFSLHREFKAAYAQLPDLPRWRIQVDLSRVDYMDSAALGMLLVLRERAGGEQARIALQGAQSTVLQILQVSSFERLFTLA